MSHKSLAEMMAQDRVAELRRAGVMGSLGTRGRTAADRISSQKAPVAIRRSHLTGPRRAIGWFLVSVGLRLALSPTRARSAR